MNRKKLPAQALARHIVALGDGTAYAVAIPLWISSVVALKTGNAIHGCLATHPLGQAPWQRWE